MLRTAAAATAALILSTAPVAAQTGPAGAEQAPAQVESPVEAPAGAPAATADGPLGPEERLSLGRSKLQQAAVRLQRARDTVGLTDDLPPEEVAQAREIATAGADEVGEAIQEMLLIGNDAEVQQALRNASVQLQSTQIALVELDPAFPQPVIQSLRDLDRAAGEVLTTSQQAGADGQPSGLGALGR